MSKVIHISSASYIALHSLAFIASSKNITNIKTISEAINMAESHVAKIIQTFVKFGYLKSTRGPKGGLILSKSPALISLLEIYESIEGEIQLDNCPTECDKCPFKKCIFGGLPQKLSQEFKNYMKNMTLQGFINENI